MREFVLKFIEARWKVLCLFFMLLLLISAHAFMIHYNRPERMITWCEGMIDGNFSALLLMLKD